MGGFSHLLDDGVGSCGIKAWQIALKPSGLSAWDLSTLENGQVIHLELSHHLSRAYQNVNTGMQGCCGFVVALLAP